MNISEIIMNQSIVPVYITTTHQITPIVMMSNNKTTQDFIVNLATGLIQIYSNFYILITLLWREITKMNINWNINWNILCIICLFGFMLYDKYRLTNVLANNIIKLENQIRYMKKQDEMRENYFDLMTKSQTQNFKQLQSDFDTKFAQIDKQVKKMDKEMKKYD